MLNGVKRETDEKDSTTAVWWNYIMALGVTGAVFTVEILTDAGILDGALIGILISKVYDGLSKQNEYYFPVSSRKSADVQQQNGGNG